MSFCLALFVSCSKDKDSQPEPANNGGISNYSFVYYVNNVTSNSAEYVFSVDLHEDNNEIQELGVCWGTNDHPAVNSGDFLVSENAGTFATFTIDNLTPATHYYVCGYFKYDGQYYYTPDSQFTTLEE